MANLDTKSNDSQMQVEAMLYLLDDPALDREAFEARLANDSLLAEILAETVSIFQSLQSVEFDSQLQSVARLAHSSVYSYRQWQAIPVIAASLLIVGFLSWQTLFRFVLDSPRSLRQALRIFLRTASFGLGVN